MRRTKIIATLGPSTDDPATLAKLFKAGVDVVRVNFSHGDADTREKRVRTVREVAEQCGKYIAVLGDLQGPKIRIQRFRDGPVQLVEGQTFTIVLRFADSTEQAVTVSVHAATAEAPHAH